MAVSSGRRQYSNRVGQLGEQRFVAACLAIGYQVQAATRQQNIYDHIDFFVLRSHSNQWSGVDVKSGNHPETIWIEFKNVTGKAGWLHGKADFFAFEMPEEGGFVMVRRLDLIDLCSEIVDADFVKDKKDAHCKLYTRKGREDVLTKLHLSDLKKIENLRVLKYESQE